MNNKVRDWFIRSSTQLHTAQRAQEEGACSVGSTPSRLLCGTAVHDFKQD